MRRSIAVALLMLAPATPAFAQLAKPPAELPGFARKTTSDGKTWWHRRVEGWDYFAAPSPEAWNFPPLSVDATAHNIRPRDFGLNVAAWKQTGESLGFTSGGGARPATEADRAPALDDAPELETGDPIELWCRRRHLDPNAVYGAAGGIGGLLLALFGLLIRRMFRR